MIMHVIAKKYEMMYYKNLDQYGKYISTPLKPAGVSDNPVLFYSSFIRYLSLR